MPIVHLNPQPSLPALTDEPLDPETVELLRGSVSPSTWRAYERDLHTIEAWCRSRGARPLPASPSTVANYVGAMSKELAATTIERRVATWSSWHKANGVPKEENPCSSELVRKALRGLRRLRSSKPTKATPLVMDDLTKILNATPGHDLRGLRDRALLTVGLALGRRRSELVALNVEDLQRITSGERNGYVVTIQRSKTDQEGHGDSSWLRWSGRPTCPVEVLDTWLRAASITSGPVFRSIDRRGNLGERLSDRSVALIVRAAATRAGLPEGHWSGHSLRAGYATDHARRGASTRSIARGGGWSPTSPVVNGYVRHAAVWDDNASDTEKWL